MTGTAADSEAQGRRVAEHIERLVAMAPPLTAEQVRRLRVILGHGGGLRVGRAAVPKGMREGLRQ